MVTMRDVAVKANVSMSTVSYVINGTKSISDEVRDRVLQAIQDLNYKPNRTAQNLARSSARCIGLFGSDIETMKTHAFLNSLLSGIMTVTSQEKYNLLIYPEPHDSEGKFLISLDHGEPIDGAIIINPRDTNDYLQRIVEINLPFVLVGRPMGYGDKINYVDSDNVAVSYNAVRYLISQGHTRVLLLSGPANYTLSMDRLEGYKMALKDYSLPFDESLVINSEFIIDDGRKAVNQFLDKNIPVTAIITDSDTQAIGAVHALRGRNIRIPKDMSLLCAGETFLSINYNPAITGIDLNITDLGKQAATHLLNIIEKKSIKPTHYIVPFSINQRETTASPD